MWVAYISDAHKPSDTVRLWCFQFDPTARGQSKGSATKGVHEASINQTCEPSSGVRINLKLDNWHLPSSIKMLVTIDFSVQESMTAASECPRLHNNAVTSQWICCRKQPEHGYLLVIGLFLSLKQKDIQLLLIWNPLIVMWQCYKRHIWRMLNLLTFICSMKLSHGYVQALTAFG